jgi:hypothetical protein
MAPRRKGSSAAPAASGHLVRVEAWAGLRPGDRVEVEGTRLRSATWAFVAHIRNTETGAEWVEVVGGRPGDRKLRSFNPDQVYAPGARRAKGGTRASLADAPQLPFG